MTDRATTQAEEQSPTASFDDPAELRARDGVEVVDRQRPMPDEKFEALRDRYDAIEGVVQVALTDGDGRVLLWGVEDAAPPGGSVDGGEDWVAAAQSAMEDVTGQAVRVEEPVFLEVTEFHREGDESESFPAPSVHFAASLVDSDEAFVEDPSVPEGFEHPMFEEDPELDWYAAVTDDVHENHRHHVERYLEWGQP
ncbi:MAG: hypothetical protein ABEJ90_01475 [Halobacterium sp.]